MSNMRISASNISISLQDVVEKAKSKTTSKEYSDDILKRIIEEVIIICKDAINVKDNADAKLINDEELFDDAYDHMMANFAEQLPSAEVARIVNEVICYIEDIFYDNGLIEYTL